MNYLHGDEPARLDGVAFEWQPDVWLLMIILGAAYLWALHRLGPSRASPSGTRDRRRRLLFFTGLLALTVSATWPLDTIADHYLFSAHIVQFLLMTLVAAPLLLAGLPAWLLLELTRPLRPVLTVLARPVVALLAFNAVLVVSHWPVLVDLYVRVDAVHFGMHVLWVASGLLLWLPVLSPLTEYRRLSAPLRMCYLFASSIIPTIPASFLTWADEPYYDVYARAPRLWGITAVEDIQLAGAVMKIGGGLILWSAITVIFVRWATAQLGDRSYRRQPVASQS